MKSFKLIFILGFISLCSFGVIHKYYLSLTEVNYVEEKQALQITSEIFIEDLQKVLRKRYESKIVLDETGNTEHIKSEVSRYLKSKLKILVNGQEVDYQFLGYEYKDDKIVCYLEALNIPKISTFEVSNTLLFDMFAKQKNMVKFKSGDIEKNLLLIKGKERESISL